MFNPIYNLRDLTFFAGETENLVFHFEKDRREPFSMDGYTVNFAVINYANKYGEPIITKTGVPYQWELGDNQSDGDGDDTHSLIQVVLDPADTVNLYGKYIYQISVKDEDDGSVVAIPGQGILTINKNIHQSFIS